MYLSYFCYKCTNTKSLTSIHNYNIRNTKQDNLIIIHKLDKMSHINTVLYKQISNKYKIAEIKVRDTYDQI